MTFYINPNIPAAANSPSQDQPVMQQNFANIAGFLAVDHTASGTTGAGEHNQVTFRLNQTAPSLASGVGGLYTNSATGLFGTMASLFFQNATKDLRLFNLPISTNATTTNASGVTNYSITTPWGLILQFGSFTITTANTNCVVTYPTAFATTTYTAIATSGGTTANKNWIVVDGTVTNSSIAFKMDDKQKFYYLVIGA